MKKVSFLMAAHNEGKIISKTLENLINLPYDNYEVILGLDGCTDNTESIVKSFCKRSKKFKYYSLNLRQGKAAVINAIIKKAKGEIVVIHDADWIFDVKDSSKMEKLIRVFEDPSIGGIADSFPIEFREKKRKQLSFMLKMTSYSSYYWLEFQKRRFAREERDLLYLKKPVIFMTNIFRKSLYKPALSLADDFERTHYIMDQGYSVVLFKESSMPRMISVSDKVTLRDFFKQKVRTAMARDQLSNLASDQLSFKEFYLPFLVFIEKNSLQDGFSIWVAMNTWIALMFATTLLSKTKKLNTREGWALRAER